MFRPRQRLAPPRPMARRSQEVHERQQCIPAVGGYIGRGWAREAASGLGKQCSSAEGAARSLARWCTVMAWQARRKTLVERHVTGGGPIDACTHMKFYRPRPSPLLPPSANALKLFHRPAGPDHATEATDSSSNLKQRNRTQLNTHTITHVLLGTV